MSMPDQIQPAKQTRRPLSPFRQKLVWGLLAVGLILAVIVVVYEIVHWLPRAGIVVIILAVLGILGFNRFVEDHLDMDDQP
jgi:CHASE2 domain-containing sensor protein